LRGQANVIAILLLRQYINEVWLTLNSLLVSRKKDTLKENAIGSKFRRIGASHRWYPSVPERANINTGDPRVGFSLNGGIS